MLKSKVLNRIEDRSNEITIDVNINNEYENFVQFCLDTKDAPSPCSSKQFQIIKNYILNNFTKEL